MILTISLYKGGIDLLVDAAIVKKFAKLSLELSKQTAIKAHKYLEEHEHINGYLNILFKILYFQEIIRNSPSYLKKFHISLMTYPNIK